MSSASSTSSFCLACCGEHKPDTDGISVVFRDFRFSRPFRCICCGQEICARQFAWGRACGKCDAGACQYGNSAYRPEYAHEHPAWWDIYGPTLFEKFTVAVGATPIREEVDDERTT